MCDREPAAGYAVVAHQQPAREALLELRARVDQRGAARLDVQRLHVAQQEHRIVGLLASTAAKAAASMRIASPANWT